MHLLLVLTLASVNYDSQFDFISYKANKKPVLNTNLGVKQSNYSCNSHLCYTDVDSLNENAVIDGEEC